MGGDGLGWVIVKAVGREVKRSFFFPPEPRGWLDYIVSFHSKYNLSRGVGMK